MSTLTCVEARQRVVAIKQRFDEFTLACQNLQPRDRLEITRLQQVQEGLKDELSRLESAIDCIELFPRQEMRKQYEESRQSLLDAEVSHKIGDKEWIYGPNGEEYLLPTLIEVRQLLRGEMKAVSKSIYRGFTRMLLVPIGASLLTALEPGFRGVATRSGFPQQALINKVFTSQSDLSKVRYGPSNNWQDGVDKQAELHVTSFPGWDVLFVEEELPPIGVKPRLVGDRWTIPQGETADYYYEQYDHEPPYDEEDFLRLEDWYTLAIQQLVSKGKLMNSASNRSEMILGNVIKQVSPNKDITVPLIDIFNDQYSLYGQARDFSDNFGVRKTRAFR